MTSVLKKVPLSIISTVYNESLSIRQFCDALLNETIFPEDIVIVDAGSQDDTVNILEEYREKGLPLQIFSQPCNRSIGRNLAIQHAKTNYLVCVDGGCLIHPGTLEALWNFWQKNPSVDVIGGNTQPDINGLLEEGFCTLLPLPPTEFELKNKTWLPTSRLIAFTRRSFSECGGYPSHIPINEDMHFVRRLHEIDCHFAYLDTAIVTWKPRSNWKEFFRQYYLYAVCDGREGIYWKNYFLKIAGYGFGLILFLFGFYYTLLWCILLGGILFYFIFCFKKALEKTKKPALILLIPWIEIVNDLADVMGFCVGLVQRFLKIY
jgi:glycosyltransferase involved in cell wall biosynthesis